MLIAAGDLTYLNGMEANPTHADFGDIARVDTTPPRLESVTANGRIVTLKFDEPLDTTGGVDRHKFSITTAVEHSPKEVSVFGNGEIILRLDDTIDPNYGSARVSYRPSIPGNGVRDRFRNEAEDFDREVTNATPTTTNRDATGEPSLPRQARQGEPLNVDVSGISDPDGVPDEKRYVWVREFEAAGSVLYVPVANTTEPTWTPTEFYVGDRIAVEVSFIDNAGHAEGPLRSATTEPVLAAARFGDLRLADGPTPSSGRLEIFRQGEWGTVCDDRFSDYQSPEVACRQLGYVTGTEVSRHRLGMSRLPGGAGGQQIWLDQVRCDGTESRLSQCPHLGFGIHNCKHEEDVHLECGPASADRPELTFEIFDIPETHNGNEFKVRIKWDLYI